MRESERKIYRRLLIFHLYNILHYLLLHRWIILFVQLDLTKKKQRVIVNKLSLGVNYRLSGYYLFFNRVYFPENAECNKSPVIFVKLSIIGRKTLNCVYPLSFWVRRMDEVLDKFNSALHTEDSRSTENSYECLYKNWGKPRTQEERRKEILAIQKEWILHIFYLYFTIFNIIIHSVNIFHIFCIICMALNPKQFILNC